MGGLCAPWSEPRGTLAVGLGTLVCAVERAERSGARAPGTTKEVLGFIIEFLAFNLDFLGFPIIVLGLF